MKPSRTKGPCGFVPPELQLQLQTNGIAGSYRRSFSSSYRLMALRISTAGATATDRQDK